MLASIQGCVESASFLLSFYNPFSLHPQKRRGCSIGQVMWTRRYRSYNSVLFRQRQITTTVTSRRFTWQCKDPTIIKVWTWITNPFEHSRVCALIV